MNYKVLLILNLIFLFINQISCEINSNSICKVGGPTLIPHECDCLLYYYCGSDGKEILKKCPYGLNFNSDLLLCDAKFHCKLDCSRKEILSIRIPNLENILRH